MKINLGSTLGVVCLAIIIVFIYSVAFSISAKGTDNIQNLPEPEISTDSSLAEEIPCPKVNTPQTIYTIKTYENGIAVFQSGKDEPINVIEMDISTLPVVDQELLKQGIRINSQTDLRRILQDYDS